MRILIAIVTCHRFRDRADIARRTWVPLVKGADVKFFLGNGPHAPLPDEVHLDVEDDYRSLRVKTQLMFGYSVLNGYDRTFKTDDDVYVIPDRLIHSLVGTVDYSGRVRGPSRENDAPRIYGNAEQRFCSGFGYWVSRRAASIIASAPDNSDWAEDRFAGQALAAAGIGPLNNPYFKLWPPLEGHACAIGPACRACVDQYKQAAVICPYDRPSAIQELHDTFMKTGCIPTRLP